MWLYINENTDKQELYAHWCKMHYLVSRSTNSLLFCSNITCGQFTLNQNIKLKNILFLFHSYHPHVIHACNWSWLKVKVHMMISGPNPFFVSILDLSLFYHPAHARGECVCGGGWQVMFEITVTCQLHCPHGSNSTLLKVLVNMIMSDSNHIFRSSIHWC